MEEKETIHAIQMELIEGGSFYMGSEAGDTDEKPVHQVTLSDYYLASYPVTQQQWFDLLKKLPHKITKTVPNLPIIEINWPQAIEYCNELSLLEGLTPYYKGSLQRPECLVTANGYRLPTEAEWEYAARGGKKSKKYQYSGSNNVDEVAWYLNNSDKTVHPVGLKKPNELNLYDMSGNIYEFCWDLYGPYLQEEQKNPQGIENGTRNPFRVIRGGNCFGMAYRTRITSRRRYLYLEGYTHDFIGFRLARNSN